MRFLIPVGTFVAAFAAALVALIAILVLGLIVHEYVVFPLALGVGAVLASLAAGWTADLLSGDGSRTRLMPVVGVVAAVGLVLAALFLLIEPLAQAILGTIFQVALVCAVALAVTATAAALRLRTPAGVAANRGRETLLLLGLVVVAVPVTIFLASLVGLAGA